MEHTPEPWQASMPGSEWIECEIRKNGDVLATVWSHSKRRETVEANARRIVACVNACRGMVDPEAEISELKKRSELLDYFRPKY